MLTVGSLFSGIGGLDLGLEQAGMKTIWQVEFDDWCREKLAENFPHTEKFKDVREVGKHNLKPVDIICGGFPCTDVSQSKFNRQGLDGESSGLWAEFARILCELRPRYALIENVANLLILDGHRIMSDLARIGFDAEWQTLRASTFGLPIRRKRLFIFAKPAGIGLEAFNFDQRAMPNKGNQAQIHGVELHLHSDSIRRKYPQIPEYLRVGNGFSYPLPEIKRAVKGYGNAVAPPVAKWLGEQIIRFDAESNY